MAAALVNMVAEIIPIHEQLIVPAPDITVDSDWPPSNRDLPLAEIIECMPEVWR